MINVFKRFKLAMQDWDYRRMDSYHRIHTYRFVYFGCTIYRRLIKMDETKLAEYLENNIELTKQLTEYNNMLAGLKFLSIFITVLVILILIMTIWY